jgi:hypothetical protein
MQPFKWLWSTELFRFHGRMQSPKQPQSPCICSHTFTLSYVMKWQNSSHLYHARFSKRARALVLKKWSDAGTPPSEMLPASPICQVSVPPSLLPFLAWKLLLNCVHFTIFVSRWRVWPQTPLDATIETTRPNVRSITLEARLPHRETQQSPLCRGSSAPTPCCYSIIFLLWWALLQNFSSHFVLQITLYDASFDAPNTTINITTSGNGANLSIDDNVCKGG